MTYFTAEIQKFFRNLSRNNKKTWFDSNRKRYEEHVKRPFAAFVALMIDLIRQDDPEVTIKPQEAIFRINRDIRFSKDKSPYNTYMAANISREGRRSKEWPGFYFQFSADRISVGGGAYMVEPPSLNKIRKAIARDTAQFVKLLKAKEFTSKYGSLKGERNKLLAPEFRRFVDSQPLIANKQFYYMTDLDSSILLSERLPDRLMSYYRAGIEINAFLRRAIESK